MVDEIVTTVPETTAPAAGLNVGVAAVVVVDELLDVVELLDVGDEQASTRESPNKTVPSFIKNRIFISFFSFPPLKVWNKRLDEHRTSVVSVNFFL